MPARLQDPLQLADRRFLIFRNDMLDHRDRIDDVERTIRKGERSDVSLAHHETLSLADLRGIRGDIDPNRCRLSCSEESEPPAPPTSPIEHAPTFHRNPKVRQTPPNRMPLHPIKELVERVRSVGETDRGEVGHCRTMHRSPVPTGFRLRKLLHAEPTRL
jgi:hypothetical protein